MAVDGRLWHTLAMTVAVRAMDRVPRRRVRRDVGQAPERQPLGDAVHVSNKAISRVRAQWSRRLDRAQALLAHVEYRARGFEGERYSVLGPRRVSARTRAFIESAKTDLPVWRP